VIGGLWTVVVSPITAHCLIPPAVGRFCTAFRANIDFCQQFGVASRLPRHQQEIALVHALEVGVTELGARRGKVKRA
jgi:hypothetical protein